MILKSAKDLHYFYAPFMQSSVFRACIVLNTFKQTKRFDNMTIYTLPCTIYKISFNIKLHLISFNIILGTQFLSGFITNLNTALSALQSSIRMLNVMMIWVIEFFKKIVTTKKPVPKVIISKVIIEHHLRILK